MITWLKKEKDSILLFLFLFTVYLYFQSHSIYGGDSGDLASAAAAGSFAHPPGYPLYSLLAGLLYRLPFYTPAWRIGLLSSLPSALSLAVYYRILKKYFPCLIVFISVAMAAFLYPVFLNSIVVEVFSLNTLLVMLILSASDSFYHRADKTSLYRLVFIIGLAVCHHHLFVFSLPAAGYILWQKKEKISKINTISFRIKLLLFFLLGLLFYLYLPYVSLTSESLFSWGRADTVKGFWSIFTRQGYGTFRAFSGIGKLPIHRLLSVYVFGRYLLLELKALGIFFLIVGIFGLLTVKRNLNKAKKVFLQSQLIMFLSFIFFLFYASFPLGSDFQMATVERFYILPMLSGVPMIILGMKTVLDFAKNRFKHTKLPIYHLIIAIFFLLPITSFTSNFGKLIILKKDFTAEKLGYDILHSLPEKSIITLATDTEIFDTQYVHYVLGYRPDVLIVNPGLLKDNRYQQIILNTHPNIIFPDPVEDKEFADFVQANVNSYPIYVNMEVDYEAVSQVPEGLLWQFYEPVSTPSAELVYSRNKTVTAVFQDLKQSSLTVYVNRYLSDIPEKYRLAYWNLTQFFLDRKMYKEADFFSQKYQQLVDENDFLALLFQGQIYLGNMECDQALLEFKKAKAVRPESALVDGFLQKTYLECYQDEAKSEEYLQQCVEKTSEQLPKLDEL